MLTKHNKLELTLKKICVGERWNGTPEECWIAKYEQQDNKEGAEEKENLDDRKGVA